MADSSQSPAMIHRGENAFQMTQCFSTWILKCGNKKGKKRDFWDWPFKFDLWRCKALPGGPHTDQTCPPALQQSPTLHLISVTALHEDVLCSQAEILHWKPRSGWQSLSASSAQLTSPQFCPGAAPAACPLGTAGQHSLQHHLGNEEPGQTLNETSPKHGTKFPQILLNTRPKMPDHLHGSTVCNNLYSRKHHSCVRILLCH